MHTTQSTRVHSMLAYMYAAHTHAHTHTHTEAHMQTHRPHAHAHTRTHMHAHTCTHTHAHMQTHRPHAHTHAHTHTHTAEGTQYTLYMNTRTHAHTFATVEKPRLFSDKFLKKTGFLLFAEEWKLNAASALSSTNPKERRRRSCGPAPTPSAWAASDRSWRGVNPTL